MNKAATFIMSTLVCAFTNTPITQVIAQEINNATAATRTSMSEGELKIWNDPAFKAQFIQSYLAETEIEPTVTAEERETLLTIMDTISADQLDEAAVLLNESRNEATGAVFEFTLANIYFQQEKFGEAAPLYQEAVEKFPKFRRAWKNLGLIFIRQSQFDKALTALTKVIELGGNDAVTYGLLAFAYSSTENFLSAESAYRMAVLLDPVTPDWKMGLARSFFKQERFGEAAALCGQLIREFPDRSDLWLLQANAYIGMNQPMQASENYEIVDKLGKSTVDSLNMLGDIYINEELYSMAANAYIRAMERAKDGNAERAIRSAKILSVRGALDETRQLIAKIESIYGNQILPDDRKAVLKLKARIAVANESGGEEARVLEEIVELDPLDGEALILLGQYYQRSGDTEKAAFYFERAAKIEPFEADAKIRHAQLLVSNGKYAEALPLLRRAQTIKPRENIQDYVEQVERFAKTGK